MLKSIKERGSQDCPETPAALPSFSTRTMQATSAATTYFTDFWVQEALLPSPPISPLSFLHMELCNLCRITLQAAESKM